MYKNKPTLETLTLRTSKGNLDFFCPSSYLTDSSATVSFNKYKNSDIIFDPYWDLIKSQFVKYSRYYTSFEDYSRDLEAFAIFYTQMSYTSRGVQNIPGYRYNPNSSQAKCKQAIDYLVMLAVRLPDIKEISRKVANIFQSEQNYEELLTTNKEATETEPFENVTEDNAPVISPGCDTINLATDLYYTSKQDIDNDIVKLREKGTNNYIATVNSLLNTALMTDQRDIKVQMLKMVGDTLTSYIKEVDLIADKLNEDVLKCQS